MNELSRNDPFMFPIGLLQKTILNFLINKAMEEDMVSLREQIFCYCVLVAIVICSKFKQFPSKRQVYFLSSSLMTLKVNQLTII